MINPNPNMLLRIAQGDAYGAASEYCERHPDKPEWKELREFFRYVPHPTHSHLLRPGNYTDDTQMSIAVAETLITAKELHNKHNPHALATRAFADSFFVAFKRDPRPGYSHGFQALLEYVESPGQLLELIHGDSKNNGACMRAVPIGVIRDARDVAAIATIQAKITHDTYGGVISAQAVALMSHYALYSSQDFSHMCEWLVNVNPALIFLQTPWSGRVALEKEGTELVGMGVVTAQAVHTLLVECGSLMEIMERIIEWGGDTDSVGAIAWGIASARYQDEVLPEFFERDLEHQSASKFKGDFLKDLGKRLMEAYA